MRYLLIGGNGLLGRDIAEALAGRDVSAPRHAELDITDAEAVRGAVAGHDVVINSAAFSGVDAAEHDEAGADAVNARGPQLLAAAAHAAGARFVQISTDYVFRGDAHSPYPERAPLDPLGAYGRSKAAGERLATAASDGHLHIVRTAWLYGAHGNNFARTIARKAEAGDTLTVVDDQIGQPTWTRDVAARVVDMLDLELPEGIYHATNAGQASWFEFARAVVAGIGRDAATVLPTDSSTYVRDAPRPAYSVLGHDGWASTPLPPLRNWREALAAAAAAGVLDVR